MGWIKGHIGALIRRLRRRGKGKEREPHPSLSMSQDLRGHVVIFDAANLLLTSAKCEDNAAELFVNGGSGAVTEAAL